MRIRSFQIRARLTLWYVAIFGLVLVAVICIASLLQYRRLVSQLYRAEVQDMETVEGLLYFTPDQRLLLREDYFINNQHKQLLDRLMEVFDANGYVLFRNDKLGNNTLGGVAVPNVSYNDYPSYNARLADGTHVLGISHSRPLDGKLLIIRLGYSTETIRLQSLQSFGILMLLVPFALVAAGFAGYRIAGEALNPLEQMARRAEHITAHRLHERIPVRNAADELGHMARVLNGMLERLEQSFEQLRRFTSDVAHELRTPLAAIRSVGEVGLQEKQDSDQYHDIIGSMLEEVARLTSMIDTLLTIANAESGAVQWNRSVFPLMGLVQESVALIRALAEEKKQTIDVAGHDMAEVGADRAFLGMAIFNLLDNAVKYSPPGSAIHLNVNLGDTDTVHPGFVELTIEDQGPGIPESARSRIFDRFYRLDEARAQDTGGVGLGLSIAKLAIEAHRGKICVRPAPNGGAIFSILMPVIGPTH